MLIQGHRDFVEICFLFHRDAAINFFNFTERRTPATGESRCNCGSNDRHPRVTYRLILFLMRSTNRHKQKETVRVILQLSNCSGAYRVLFLALIESN